MKVLLITEATLDLENAATSIQSETSRPLATVPTQSRLSRRQFPRMPCYVGGGGLPVGRGTSARLTRESRSAL